jgi:hypothetical protein
MPWSKKQQKVARAVEHGWKPKGSAQGFTQDFAAQVVRESDEPKRRKMMKKHLHVESNK